MAPRLSGQTSIFGVVFFVSKSLLGIDGQRKLEKFAILTRKPRSHARILIYRTWSIGEGECNAPMRHPYYSPFRRDSAGMSQLSFFFRYCNLQIVLLFASL